jgi:excisionase family DNA binding protein
MGQFNLADYMTIKEAAEYLGVNPMTLRRWDNDGKLDTKRHPINNYRLYLKKDLDKILNEIRTLRT